MRQKIESRLKKIESLIKPDRPGAKMLVWLTFDSRADVPNVIDRPVGGWEIFKDGANHLTVDPHAEAALRGLPAEDVITGLAYGEWLAEQYGRFTGEPVEIASFVGCPIPEYEPDRTEPDHLGDLSDGH